MTASPEFSRPLSIEGITPDKARKESLKATEEECGKLAERFDLRGLSGLKADLVIRRVAGGATVRVAGTIAAEVVQACVVSLRDVHNDVKTEFEAFFTEDEGPDGDIEYAFETDEEPPEMISNGMIDLGEITAQYLALALDPYPRAPGVSLAAQMAASGVPARENPFSVLKGDKKQ